MKLLHLHHPLHNVLIPLMDKVFGSDINIIPKDLDLMIGKTAKNIAKALHEMEFIWVGCCSLHHGCVWHTGVIC